MAVLNYTNNNFYLTIELYDKHKWLLPHISDGLDRLFLIYNTKFKDISLRENWYHLFKILENMNLLYKYIESLIYEFLEEGDLTGNISHSLILFIQNKSNDEIMLFINGMML